MSDQETEKQIQAAGADKAPRITPADIEANIVSEHYFTAADGVAGAGPVIAAEFWNHTSGHAIVDYSEHTHVGHLTEEKGYDRRPLVHRPEPTAPLGLLTFCVLVLRNGFTVTGESACASPENFNAEIGRKIAREKAIEDVWKVMGYELRSKLAAQPKDFRDRVRAEAVELDERINKLRAFRDTDTFAALPAGERGRMIAQLSAMLGYSGCLAARIAAFEGAA